jgi:hypothetical protein
LSIDKLITEISSQNIYSETEVRTKVAIPIFQLLGYPDQFRAEEFPVYGFDGRKQLNTKFADLLFFSNSSFNSNRDRKENLWVHDHSLVVIEVKKPTESMDVQGQAVFYSMWARAPLYVITNGIEVAAYRTESLFRDTLLFKCTIQELSIHWTQVHSILSWDAVIIQYGSKPVEIGDLNKYIYSDYVKSSVMYLETILKNVLSRTLIEHSDGVISNYSFPLKISGNISGYELISEPYQKLIQTNESTLILAEPGGGKTYLLQMIAKDVYLESVSSSYERIPVLISAKLWNRSFKNIIEAIYNEIKYFVPALTLARVEVDLQKGKFLILIDGLDEVFDSVDTLYAELIKISRINSVCILATCRRENYFQELREGFNTCILETLNQEQIEEYAQLALGEKGEFFLHKIGKTLGDLIHNPLFLFMTIEVVKSSVNRNIPENRAELYSVYTKFLLNDWYKNKSLPQKLLLDQTTKETILSEYAEMTFRNSGNNHLFNTAINKTVGSERLVEIREELLNSGLLKSEYYGPEFYHPSIQEYFYALHLSNQTDDLLKEFMGNYHSDNNYYETLIFLSGLLRQGDRQSILLDFLEETNIFIYQKCLEARFDRTEQLELNLTHKFISEYFGQVRKSYLALVSKHFSLEKDLFHPWRDHDTDEIDNDYDIVINGSMNLSKPSVSYNFELIRVDSEKPRVKIKPPAEGPSISFTSAEGIQKAIPIISMSTSDGYMYYDLVQTTLGIDSAREVAIDAIKKQLKEMIKKKMLLWGEDHSIGCEIVEKELNNLSNGVVVPMPKEFKNLSLYTHSVADLISIFQPYSKVTEFRHPDGYGKKINAPMILYYLLKMNSDGINHTEYLLPKADLRWEDISEKVSYVWSNWSDQRICEKVGRFYDFYQRSYRFMVETCFPTLKDDLYFYHIGPVRFKAIIIRNKEEQDFGGYINLSWRPVANGESTQTLVEFSESEIKETYDDNEREFDEIAKQLIMLGRKSDHIVTGGGTSLSEYTGSNDFLRKEVYEQLFNDFKHLFKKF